MPNVFSSDFEEQSEHASGIGREGMRMNFRIDGGLDYRDGERPPEVPG